MKSPPRLPCWLTTTFSPRAFTYIRRSDPKAEGKEKKVRDKTLHALSLKKRKTQEFHLADIVSFFLKKSFSFADRLLGKGRVYGRGLKASVKDHASPPTANSIRLVVQCAAHTWMLFWMGKKAKYSREEGGGGESVKTGVVFLILLRHYIDQEGLGHTISPANKNVRSTHDACGFFL